MTAVLRRPDISNYKWMSEQEQDLFIAMALLETPEEARDFLADLLAVQEVRFVAKRWHAARLLLEGMVQSEVCERCNLSRNVVTRVNVRVIKYGSGIVRRLYKRLLDGRENTN